MGQEGRAAEQEQEQEREQEEEQEGKRGKARGLLVRHRHAKPGGEASLCGQVGFGPVGLESVIPFGMAWWWLLAGGMALLVFRRRVHGVVEWLSGRCRWRRGMDGLV